MNKINKQTLTISDPVASHVEPECSVAPVEFFRNYFIHHRHIQVDGVVKKQRVDWTLYTKELSLNFSLKTNVHFLHWQPHVLLHYLVKHWCQKTSKYCDQRKITKRRSWGVVGFLIINFGRAPNYLLNHVIPVSFIVSRQRLGLLNRTHLWSHVTDWPHTAVEHFLLRVPQRGTVFLSHSDTRQSAMPASGGI